MCGMGILSRKTHKKNIIFLNNYLYCSPFYLNIIFDEVFDPKTQTNQTGSMVKKKKYIYIYIKQ